MELSLPRKVICGGGAITKLGSLLSSMQLFRPLVVADRFLTSPESGAVDAVRVILEKSFVRSFDVFTDITPDPTTESIARCVQALGASCYDCVVAIGGGSSIDSAKAAAMLHCHGGSMRDYKAPFIMDAPSLPIIAIPTTAGTGSEVTKVTIVTDSETDEKMLCMGLSYLPVATILDYELTLTKPFRLTADTGIDAVCHAMEAFVSAKKNPLTDELALAAMDKLGKSLYTACEQPTNRYARESMLLGSYQAGLAFSNSSVTLIHGMSRPLGARFHIPHGMCNAMLMSACTRFGIDGAVERYAIASRTLGLADHYGSDEDAAKRMPAALQKVARDLKVPTLEGFGLNENAFRKAVPAMAADALASGSPSNNPIVPNQSQIEALYHAIWDEGAQQIHYS